MAQSFPVYIMVGFANNQQWCDKYSLCLKTFSAKVQMWNERVSKRSFGDLIHDFVLEIRGFQDAKPELFHFWEMEEKCPLQASKMKDFSEKYIAHLAQAVYYLAERIVRLSQEQWQPLYQFMKRKVENCRLNGQNGRNVMDTATASYNDRLKWNLLLLEMK